MWRLDFAAGKAKVGYTYRRDPEAEVDDSSQNDHSVTWPSAARGNTLQLFRIAASAPVARVGETAMSVQLYMDVHVHRAMTEGLRLRGVDVLRAQEDGADEFEDDELLDRANWR